MCHARFQTADLILPLKNEDNLFQTPRPKKNLLTTN